MDEEKPRALGSIATRIVCTLIGLLLVYVLSSGPAAAVDYKFPRSRPLIEKLYGPLWVIASQTPLKYALGPYVEFWMTLAGYHPAN